MKKRVILYILSVIGIVILNCLYVNFEFMVGNGDCHTVIFIYNF